VLAFDVPGLLSLTAAWDSHELNRRVSLLVLLGLGADMCRGAGGGGGREERKKSLLECEPSGPHGVRQGGEGRGACQKTPGGNNLLQVIARARAQGTNTGSAGGGEGGGEASLQKGGMRVVAVTDGVYSDAPAIAAAMGGHAHVMSLDRSVPPGVSLTFATGLLPLRPPVSVSVCASVCLCVCLCVSLCVSVCLCVSL